MTSETSKLAILFADISGSTRLYELLGDIVARQKVAECLDAIVDVIKNHKGEVTKTIGDEVMCTFPSAEDAAFAACDMHESLEDDMDDESIALSVRVGFHYGPAVLDGGDVFGDAVNIASRMASMAKGGQIITTKSAIEDLPPMLRATSRFIDRAPVRGKWEAIDIYEIIWQEEDVTQMVTNVTEHYGDFATLCLRYHDREFKLSECYPLAVLGRSDACDMTIDEMLASRQHVRIECRRGKFYIIDQSTNGTYVRTPSMDEAFLRRDEMQLSGSGEISLGRPFRENRREVVHYALEY